MNDPCLAHVEPSEKKIALMNFGRGRAAMAHVLSIFVSKSLLHFSVLLQIEPFNYGSILFVVGHSSHYHPTSPDATEA